MKRIQPQELLYRTFPKEINPALPLEGYISREGLKYVKLPALAEAKTIISGTLRYRGFCQQMRYLMELGLFTKEKIKVEKDQISVRDLIEHLLRDAPIKAHKLSVGMLNYIWAKVVRGVRGYP